jgi:hypothetical protein
VSRTMSCDLVETRMRIRPRESSLSHPFAAASFVPPSKGERTAPWLDRACDAVPARLAATLHDERNGHRPEMSATSFLPTTLRRRAPTFRSVIRWCLPLRAILRMHGAFSRRPTHFGSSRFLLFEAGVLFPRRRPTAHPLTLPSPRSACPPRACGPTGGDPPSRVGNEEVSASARPRSLSHVDP